MEPARRDQYRLGGPLRRRWQGHRRSHSGTRSLTPSLHPEPRRLRYPHARHQFADLDFASPDRRHRRSSGASLPNPAGLESQRCVSTRVVPATALADRSRRSRCWPHSVFPQWRRPRRSLAHRALGRPSSPSRASVAPRAARRPACSRRPSGHTGPACWHGIKLRPPARQDVTHARVDDPVPQHITSLPHDPYCTLGFASAHFVNTRRPDRGRKRSNSTRSLEESTARCGRCRTKSACMRVWLCSG